MVQWRTWKKKHLKNCFSIQQTDSVPHLLSPGKIFNVSLHVSQTSSKYLKYKNENSDHMIINTSVLFEKQDLGGLARTEVCRCTCSAIHVGFFSIVFDTAV